MFLFRKEDAKTDAVELNDSGVSLSKLRHSRNADKVCGFRFAKQGCGNGLNLFTLRFNKGKFAESVVHLDSLPKCHRFRSNSKISQFDIDMAVADRYAVADLLDNDPFLFLRQQTEVVDGQ